jgi:hypothetical protein
LELFVRDLYYRVKESQRLWQEFRKRGRGWNNLQQN